MSPFFWRYSHYSFKDYVGKAILWLGGLFIVSSMVSGALGDDALKGGCCTVLDRISPQVLGRCVWCGICMFVFG
jgi:hypothetical protein